MNNWLDDKFVDALVDKVTTQLDCNSILAKKIRDSAMVSIGEDTKNGNLEQYFENFLLKSEYRLTIENMLYMSAKTTHPTPHHLTTGEQLKEPVSYLRRAQVHWEKRIMKSVNSMCTELSIPLAKMRSDKDAKELLGRWYEMGDEISTDLGRFRPVYAPKDFLEVIAGIRNPNLIVDPSPAPTSTSTTAANISGPVPMPAKTLTARWGIVQATLATKSIQELRNLYSDLSMDYSQGGLDDTEENFAVDRIAKAKTLIDDGHATVIQKFCRRGCPITYRPELWMLMLGVPQISDYDKVYYNQLKEVVLDHDIMVDNLIYKDVKLTVTNDDQYFVFQDYLYQVLLPFSRDTYILKHFKYSSSSPSKSYIRGKLSVPGYDVIYPPNGVIPFHGFSMYVAPLCYIYDQITTLYYVFRRLYTLYFYHLHNISSHFNGIVSLSLLFESLLQSREPQLFYHLKSMTIQPLKIAFKWIIRAFSGYLASEQVLILWDRILAYDSLEIIAEPTKLREFITFTVLAHSIFVYRKTNLLQVSSYTAAEAVLSDLTTIKVIPLIQMSLFTE